MGERLINQKFNVHNKYNEMNIVNPYRYAAGLTPLQQSIISYWNFDDQVEDQVGTNDGTATGIDYVSVPAYTVDGKSAELLSVTDKIVVADDDTLSFGNGSSDSAFSISVWVQRNTTNNQVIYCKRKIDGTANEYMLLIVNGDLWFRCFSGGSSSNYIRAYVDYNGSLPGSSSIVNWLVTYDGSGVNSGLKIYEDGVLATTINDTVGTYTAMTNDVGDFSIGHAYSNDSNTLNGHIEELYIFNKELDSTEAQFVYDEGAAGRTLI